MIKASGVIALGCLVAGVASADDVYTVGFTAAASSGATMTVTGQIDVMAGYQGALMAADITGFNLAVTENGQTIQSSNVSFGAAICGVTCGIVASNGTLSIAPDGSYQGFGLGILQGVYGNYGNYGVQGFGGTGIQDRADVNSKFEVTGQIGALAAPELDGNGLVSGITLLGALAVVAGSNRRFGKMAGKIPG